MINKINTTVSNNRVHIAADSHYIGSVNSYNNFFTKLFSRIFQRSMSVDFEGKIININKNSYLKFIRRVLSNNIKLKNFNECRVFRNITEMKEFKKQNVLMRSAISKKTADSLFRKLAQAIAKEDTAQALTMIESGAVLDTPYFFNKSNAKVTFNSDTDNLYPENKRYKFTIFKGTPLLMAAMMSNHTIVKKLKEFGANTTLQGQQYIFKRTILSVSNEHKNAIVKREDTRKSTVNYSLNSSLELVRAG